jgi:carboxylesterase
MTKNKRLRWILRGVLLLVVLVGLVLTGLSCAWRHDFYHDGTSHPRDPETGIMEGAEPVIIDRGRGRVVFMLHGWLTTTGDFGELPAAVDEAGWDVHAPLMPGQGKHPQKLIGKDADEFVAWAQEQYNGLQERYETVVLLGFSTGGALCGMMAEDDPPHKLVLVSPYLGVRYKWYYILPPTWWNTIISPIIPYVGRGDTVHTVNREEAKDDIPTYTAIPTSTNETVFEIGRRFREETDPARITCPVLMLLAPGDDVVDTERAREFFRRMPNEGNALWSAERSNHHILRDYDREAAIERIVQFLGRDGEGLRMQNAE